MKRTVITFSSIFLAIIAWPTLTSAQIQIFGKYTQNAQVAPDINVFGYGQKIDSAGKLKIAYFALVEKSWAEGLAGVIYSPLKCLELGVYSGIETNPALWRLASSIWLGTGKFSFFAWGEKGSGADNWWYKGVISYTVSKNFSAGLMSWRYNSTGIFLKFNDQKHKIKPWINLGRDLEFKVNRLTLGLDLKI